MAKLKGPLFSLGASQQLGKALVFFGWKGLNVVREYVVPSNPRTAPQTTQRGWMTQAVAGIHFAQTTATFPLDETDTSAYALWGSIFATPRTWFNQAVKNWIDQRVASKAPIAYGGGATTPGASSLAVEVYANANLPTAGAFHYGTSKTALINTQAATCVGRKMSATIAGLTTGTKYYWQFRPTTPASMAGSYSGIYYGVAA